MDDSVLLNYINSLMTEKTAVKVNQLKLINEGKRTPSNLFIAEKNHLQSLFNAQYDLSTKQWEEALHRLYNEKYIQVNEGVYTGTAAGEKRKKEFLRDNAIFSDTDSLEFAQTRKEIWTWFVFVSQVLSEYAFDNKNYIPYSSNRENQRRIKNWLKKQKKPLDELRQLWSEDLIEYMKDLPDNYRYLLIDQLVGYNKEGLTDRQLSEKYKLSKVELDIVMNQLMQVLITRQFGSESVINSLIQEVHLLNNKGLSHSASVTLKLINQSWSLEAISRERRIKMNTVKEHILEAVLVMKTLQVSLFVPNSYYYKLNKLFDERPDLTYREAMEKLAGCEFFWYRLVEIERMRRMDG